MVPEGCHDLLVSIYLERFAPDQQPILPISIGRLYTIEMLLSRGLEHSLINRDVYTALRRLGLALPAQDNQVRLSDLSVPGHALPDLDVEIGPIPYHLPLQGILGANFYGHFVGYSFDEASGRLTLIDP